MVTRAAAALVFLLTASASIAHAQALDGTQRAHLRDMLHRVHEVVRSTYYDPAFKGIDLKAHFKTVQEKLDAAPSAAMAHALIAQSLLDLNDSHTYFVPPMRPDKYDYGWEMQMIGDACFVVAVKPGSDAEAKGLKAGDQLLRIEQFAPSRKDLWKLQYAYYVLAPRPAVRVVALSPGGQPRQLELQARVTKGDKVVKLHLDLEDGGLPEEYRQGAVRDSRTARVGDISILRLASFGVEPRDVDRLFDVAVNGAASLVIDLRGNPGGYVKTLEHVASRLFDQDIKIADVKGRRAMKPLAAKKRKNAFSGKVVLLVDANSASASEVLARLAQLEGRGTVIGDRSAGSVMQGVRAPGVLEGLEGFILFEVSVTNADLIMKDGKSLEHVGVTPDELLVPTAADLAAGRDPVLARAVAVLGGTLDPAAAGRMFPLQWK